MADSRRDCEWTVDRLAEAIWDARESRDPSGELTGCTDDDRSRRVVFWAEAVERDMWPASRDEQISEARLVLDLLAQREREQAS